MQKPKISVIVTAYNIQDYIVRCLESIKGQTYENLEVIIIDDGSKDNSGPLIDEFCKTDNRFNVYHIENGGVSAARNMALDKATGEYIGIVDGDDIIEPEMYETLMCLLESKEADIAMCDFYRSSNPVKNNEHKVTVYTRDELFPAYLEDSIPSYLWNKLYKAKVLDGLRFPVGLTFEDMFFCYRAIYNADTIVTTSDTLYQYNDENPTSITHEKNSFRNKKGICGAFRDHVQFALDHNIKDMGNLLNRTAKENTDFYRTADKETYKEELQTIKEFIKKHRSLLLGDKRVDIIRKAFVLLISFDII